MKIYGRKSGSSHDEPGSVYARAQTAGWLLKALPQKGMVNGFFECLQWVAGDLRRILQAVMKEAEKTTRQSGIVRARQAVKEALAKSRHRHANELDSLLDYPCLEGIIHNAVVHACGMVQKLCEKRAGPYTAALKRLEQTFGLHNDCQALCEFAFIHQNFSAIGQYFGYNIGNYENRRLLAHMLDLPVSRLQRCLDELVRFGLIKAYNKD
ncbi:MAG: hypothetical protein FWH34_09280, partial [Desulfovibrionaceae bacterium]|nr:hypothetical protein [Desulfovibrionaceae bacterium]